MEDLGYLFVKLSFHLYALNSKLYMFFVYLTAF